MNRGRNHSADHGSGNRLHYVRANTDRKSTRLNSSHSQISYAVFCLKKKKKMEHDSAIYPHTCSVLSCDAAGELATVFVVTSPVAIYHLNSSRVRYSYPRAYLHARTH